MPRWRTEEPAFCPLCGVTLDLHDGPDSCSSAEAKADLLGAFDRMIGLAR